MSGHRSSRVAVGAPVPLQGQQLIRLETVTRYYLCAIQLDLFGGWELWRAWGAKGSRLGNSMRCPAADVDHAEQMLAEVLDVRVAHGYRQVLVGST